MESEYLKKGGSRSFDWLAKSSGRKLAFVGLGWDSPADLDASLIMLGANGKPRSQNDLYFYNHLSDERNSPIIHTGDARESAADDNGDEEVILIDFDKIPADVVKLAVVVSIYNESGPRVVFGEVDNAYARVCSCTDETLWLKGEGGKEEAHYDLTEDASTANAMLFCEIVREGTGWSFKALGESIGNGSDENGLVSIVKKYGL